MGLRLKVRVFEVVLLVQALCSMFEAMATGIKTRVLTNDNDVSFVCVDGHVVENFSPVMMTMMR